MRQRDVTNTPWERLAPQLPPHTPKLGRPAYNHRAMLNGIWWILRTGAPWRDLPERYGPWPTVASRVHRWQRAGVWQKLVDTLKPQADAGGHLNWLLRYIASTIIHAHPHAAGAQQVPQAPRP
jgi:transposase